MRWFSNLKGLIFLILILLLVGLACNLPAGDTEDVPTPPSGTRPPTTTPVETAVGPSPTVTSPGSEQTPLPTFTRIQPTLAATVTPRATTTRLATATVGPTPTPTEDPGTGEPLSFTYTINWRLDTANPFVAIASVVISAQGGGGQYRYFRDDLPVDGPAFEYPWAACTANPGSLRVDSADGQSVKVDYFEQPPCPTPTPSAQ